MRSGEWIGHRRLRAFGARIYFHWSVFAVAGILLIASLDDPVHAILAIVSYVAIIVIHECGHAWVARRRRYAVDELRIAMFHGRCIHESADYELDDVAIAWGGVLAQFAVAIPMLVIAALTPPEMLGPAAPAVMILGRVNVFLALINLIPANGLDGQKAWRVIPLARDWWRSRRKTRQMMRKWTRR